MGTPFMTVENGKGEVVELELVDTINIDSKEYVIVSQIGKEDAFAYRVDDKSGKRKYSSIGAGAEFKKVYDAYIVKHQND